jgi:hypothetical protein
MSTVFIALSPTYSELLKGDSEGLLKLPTDKVLVEDPEFRRYVEQYAKVHTVQLPSSIHAPMAPEIVAFVFS